MGRIEHNQVKHVGVRPTGLMGATQIAKWAYANNSTAIVHTVTTGKTLYLTSIIMSAVPIAAGEAHFSVRDTGDTLAYHLGQTRCLINAGFISPASFQPALEIPAGYDIYVVSDTANFLALLSIFGWEE